MADVKRIAFMASSRSVPDLYAADAEKIYNWHGGNTGNVAFVNAIASHLSGEVSFVSWNTPPEHLRRAGDVVVIACANQLGPHTDLGRTADNLDKAGLPILALGLGVQGPIHRARTPASRKEPGGGWRSLRATPRTKWAEHWRARPIHPAAAGAARPARDCGRDWVPVESHKSIV